MTTPLKSFQGPFLFINKDASSIKQRSAEEAYAIGSHVSGRYTRWSKISRLRDSDIGKAKLPTNASTRESSENETAKEENHIASTQSSSPDTYHLRPDSSPQKRTGRSTQTSKQLLRSRVQQTPPNPMTIMQYGNSDPFSACSVQITPFNNYLITTWHTIFTQTVYPSELLHIAPVTSNEGADMLACPERVHFLLAWALMLQISAMPASQTKQKLEVEALAHKSAGLNSLQKNLPKMAKLTAIRAVWHLLGTEFYAGNSATALIHFHAMVNMVKSIGGLKSLPWELMKLIVVSDMTLSAMFGARSAFDVDEWDPGSVTPILLPSEADILAANSLTQRPLHSSIPLRLTTIFHSYRELLALHRLAATTQNPSRLPPLLLWAQMRQYALSTRVTNIKAVIDALPPSAEIFIEKATCVAVDYFLQILWLKNHTERTVIAPFHHADGATEILQGAALLEWSPLTLWILFVAAAVELILRRRGQRGSVFGRRFKSILLGLGFSSLSEVRESLSQFLYQGEAYDQYLRALVDPEMYLEDDLDRDIVHDVAGKKTFVASFLAPARFGIQLSRGLKELEG